MKWLDWRDQMANVAERWKAQYYKDDKWYGGLFRSAPSDASSIHASLLALAADAVPADVQKIIGTDGWVSFQCDECNQTFDEGVQLGAEPDYESATATLCVDCFNRAARLVAIHMEKNS